MAFRLNYEAGDLMKPDRNPDELIRHWALSPDERALLITSVA